MAYPMQFDTNALILNRQGQQQSLKFDDVKWIC